jgi:hypothetical protein
MCSAGLTSGYDSNYWYHSKWDDESTKTQTGCNCIEFDGKPANCGQNFKYEGISTPWCYVSQKCKKYYRISDVDSKTPWDRCPSFESTSALGDPVTYAAE